MKEKKKNIEPWLISHVHIYINLTRGLRGGAFLSYLFFVAVAVPPSGRERSQQTQKGEEGRRSGCGEEPHVTRGQDAFEGQKSVGIDGLQPEVDSSSSRPIKGSKSVRGERGQVTHDR